MYTIIVSIILALTPVSALASQSTAVLNFSIIIPQMLRVDSEQQVGDKWVYTITTNMRTVVIDGDRIPVPIVGTITIERQTKAQTITGQ